MSAPPSSLWPLPTRRATRELARALARVLAAGDVVILSGALGAGKTFLVRALCRALGLPAEQRVTSPTFALINQLSTVPPVAHADLYRLGSAGELDELGLRELRERGFLLLVEWGERFTDELGPDVLSLSIELNPRRARFAATGPRSREQVALLAQSRHAPEPPAG
jgi:tRNA threonylcarbamoyl adenosine modification protein YjeE